MIIQLKIFLPFWNACIKPELLALKGLDNQMCF